MCLLFEFWLHYTTDHGHIDYNFNSICQCTLVMIVLMKINGYLSLVVLRCNKIPYYHVYTIDCL